MPLITRETKSCAANPLHTLLLVYQVIGKIDMEAPAGTSFHELYEQCGGITSAEIFQTILDTLEAHGRAPEFFGAGGRKIIISNFLKSLAARQTPQFDVSRDGLRCVFASSAPDNYVSLRITQFASKPVLPWEGWVSALSKLRGFAQAVLLDDEYDRFQNECRLAVHEAAGRDTKILALVPAAGPAVDAIVDVSRNPGRRPPGFGYEEVVAGTMWLGPGFWSMAGDGTRQRLLAGDWPVASELDGDVLRLDACPHCFVDATDAETLDRLRELVYADARPRFRQIREKLDRQRLARQTAVRARWVKVEHLKRGKQTDVIRQNAEKARAVQNRKRGKTTSFLNRAIDFVIESVTTPDEDASRTPRDDPGPAAAIPPMPAFEPEFPCSGFGFKTAWITVPAGKTDELARELGIREPEWTPWPLGVEAAYDPNVINIAVTPPLAGWVLAFGNGMFAPAGDDVLLARLSQKFRMAQAFTTNRISETHSWALWRGGVLVRSLRFADGLVQKGTPTKIEEPLILPLYEGAGGTVDEEDVMRVAAAWSIAPDSVDCEKLLASHLLTGWLP